MLDEERDKGKNKDIRRVQGTKEVKSGLTTLNWYTTSCRINEVKQRRA